MRVKRSSAITVVICLFLFFISFNAGAWKQTGTNSEDELLTRTLNQKKYKFGIYLGDDPDMIFRLTVFKNVVLDISNFSKQEIEIIQNTGTRVFARIPIASVVKGTTSYKEFKNKKIIKVPHTDDTYYVYPTGAKWKKRIVSTLAGIANEKEAKGFYFVDPAVYSVLETEKQEKVASDIYTILYELKKKYPKTRIILEDALPLLSSEVFQEIKLKKYIYGISQRGVNYLPDYSAEEGGLDTYVDQEYEEREEYIKNLGEYENRNLKIYTIDFTQTLLHRQLAVSRAKKNGFVSFVGTRDLDNVLWYGGLRSSVETRPFSSDSIWNTHISDGAVVDTNSDEMVDTLRDGYSLNRIFINVEEWTVPIYYVDSSTSLQSIPCVNCGPGYTGSVRIPDFALADPTFDGLISIIDVEEKRSYDLYRAINDDGKWSTTSGFSFDLTSTGIQEISSTSTSCRGAGFPLVAGLIRRDEIIQGYIPHALVMAIDYPRQSVFVWPASATDGRSDEEYAIPEGARIQLNPELDIYALGLSRSGEIIARALQEYGAFVADNADGIAIYAEGRYAKEPTWDGLLTSEEITAISFDELRVLELGELKTNPYLTNMGAEL